MPAKMVMASANLFMDVRHRCRKRKRIAEINVPACPIPTHQTKLIIAQPHPTGTFKPQMPVPVAIRYPIEKSNKRRSDTEMLNATHHMGGVVPSVTSAILRVTEPNV
jgi:hypothetical protein